MKLAAAAVGSLCLAALLALLPPDAGAAEDDPTATVRETVDSVIEVLRNEELPEATQLRQIEGLVGRHFAFRLMANRVLATNWRKASTEQRARFTALFKELLINTYWQKISRYSGETVRYTGVQMRSERYATVTTVVNTDRLEIPVDYKLVKGDEGWVAYDVVIEQVSLVRNYRGSFQSIVKDDGIDGLIRELELRVAKSSALNQNS